MGNLAFSAGKAPAMSREVAEKDEDNTKSGLFKDEFKACIFDNIHFLGIQFLGQNVF
jgi:hypothetical protein